MVRNGCHEITVFAVDLMRKEYSSTEGFTLARNFGFRADAVMDLLFLAYVVGG